MSEKKNKEDRKLKLMTEEAGLDETARSMAKSIAKMYEDRDKKALDARDHLVNQILVTSDKYLTANGVMSALEIVRDVFADHKDPLDIDEEIDIAKSAAKHMSQKAKEMSERAASLDPEDLYVLCDGYYSTDFANKRVTALDIVYELMALQLCQNVGPSADDIVSFIDTADKEIEKAREDLRTFCSEHDLDFNEICGPHENCPICLCMCCANDCKDGKLVNEDQSVYDVCEKFVKQE